MNVSAPVLVSLEVHLGRFYGTEVTALSLQTKRSLSHEGDQARKLSNMEEKG